MWTLCTVELCSRHVTVCSVTTTEVTLKTKAFSKDKIQDISNFSAPITVIFIIKMYQMTTLNNVTLKLISCSGLTENYGVILQLLSPLDCFMATKWFWFSPTTFIELFSVFWQKKKRFIPHLSTRWPRPAQLSLTFLSAVSLSLHSSLIISVCQHCCWKQCYNVTCVCICISLSWLLDPPHVLCWKFIDKLQTPVLHVHMAACQ